MSTLRQLTTGIRKTDLLLCRPDLQDDILALDDADLTYIGEQMRDLMRETYWSALNHILKQYKSITTIDATAR